MYVGFVAPHFPLIAPPEFYHLWWVIHFFSSYECGSVSFLLCN